MESPCVQGEKQNQHKALGTVLLHRDTARWCASPENAWVLLISNPVKTHRQAETNEIVNKINSLRFGTFYVVKNENKPMYLPDSN